MQIITRQDAADAPLYALYCGSLCSSGPCCYYFNATVYQLLQICKFIYFAMRIIFLQRCVRPAYATIHVTPNLPF